MAHQSLSFRGGQACLRYGRSVHLKGLAHDHLSFQIMALQARIDEGTGTQGTLHGVEGKTADPGFIAHWSFPSGLSKESIWLSYYVSLSRPRSLSKLLSHGLPDRNIIEGGPPDSIADAFQEMFAAKIESVTLFSSPVLFVASKLRLFQTRS